MSKRLFLDGIKSKRSNAPICVASNSSVVIKANSAEASLSFTKRAGVRAEHTGKHILLNVIVEGGIHGEPLQIAQVLHGYQQD